MRILEYKINTSIYVKAEITKLTALPIVNDSDNYYIVIPTVVSSLPDNVMFIQETLIINPHSKAEYIPKIVKLGVTLSQSLAMKLPKGIELRLLIIDNINDMAIRSTKKLTSKSVIKSQQNNKEDVLSNLEPINNTDSNTINMNNGVDTIITDGEKIKVDDDRKFLIDIVDKKIEENERKEISNQSNNMKYEINISEVQTDNNIKSSKSSTNSSVKKKKNRRKKDPITGELKYPDEAMIEDVNQETQSVVTSDEN